MKRLLIPFVILVVIVVVWLVQSSHEKKRISAEVTENFLDLDPGDINGVVIYTLKDTLHFQKESDGWILRDSLSRKADDVAVSNIVKSAAEIKVGRAISENPANRGEFRVDTVQGTLAEFYAGQDLLGAVIIGKSTPDQTHTYIRKPGENEVYAARGGLSYAFNRERGQWLDKSIFSLESDSVRSIGMIYPGNSYRLSHADSLWYISKKPYTDSIIADSTAVALFVNRLCRLYATDFLNPTDRENVDFNNLAAKFNITMLDGEKHSVEIARPENEKAVRYFCRKPDMARDTLVISKVIYTGLERSFSDFMPK